MFPFTCLLFRLCERYTENTYNLTDKLKLTIEFRMVVKDFTLTTYFM